VQAETIQALARECGFDLAGATPAAELYEAGFYARWVEAGFAGRMTYLTDYRAALRVDPRLLLPSARSVISVAKLYRGPEPYSTAACEPGRGWISRYAWGEDYHGIMWRDLERLARLVAACAGGHFEWRAAVDTAPLMERALARRAGLGWIGKNSCLIHQRMGSWLFLGELLVSIEVEPGVPALDRCGSCRRCIDACPTGAIVPAPGADGPAWTIDARLCISYLTIELRGPVPEPLRAPMGNHVFGCDICQDVCPWNRRAPLERDPRFAPRHFAPPLERLAALTASEFREQFGNTPVERARHAGLVRSAAIAMGNSGERRFAAILERLAGSDLAGVAEYARWALENLRA
jgi:epoxyqueuosine reductase